jgi:type IV pilus assembly protein PilC
MPDFQYEALNESGKPQKGSISAANPDDAIARIRSQGLFPTSVREDKAKAPKGKGGGGGGGGGKKKHWTEISISVGSVSGKALTAFTRQLSTLQDAGLPILRSLEILQQQQKPGVFKDILGSVHEDVSSGMTLSDAMAKHPKAFDMLYCKMIAAGEIGGVLDLILQRLAEFMEKAAKLKRKIVGAMVYPAVVIGVAGLIVTAIMIFIVPKFEKIFEDFGTDLPFLTKFLINSSKWLAGRAYPTQMIPGLVYIAFFPPGVIYGLKFLRKTKPGKIVLDLIALKLPVAGPLIQKNTIAKFTRTLGTLIGAGVPILDAINITKETTGNWLYARTLGQVYESVRQGDSFAEPIRKAKVADALVVNMIDVGEETGDLDKMLMKVADNYDDEVDTMVASLVSLLEPLMVVVLGTIVGFIVLALFLPLVKLIQAVA